MSSAQAPPDGSTGSGRIVREQSQRQVDAVENLSLATPAPTSRGRSSVRRQVRRTNLLSMLSEGERRAFLQEQLDQAAIFRQIACAKNGVTGPIERNVIGDMPSDETIQEHSEETGVPEDEIRRRERLARREAMVEVREEVLRRQEEMLANQGGAPPAPVEPATPTPQPAEPGISEEEAQLREDLARREAELAAREADIQRRQQEAQQAAEDARRAAEQRAEEQRLEAAKREKAYQDRLAELADEERKRREAEEERLKQQREQQQARDQEAERRHQAAMDELARQRRELEDQLRRAQEAANQRPTTPTEPPVQPQPTQPTQPTTPTATDPASLVKKSLPWAVGIGGPALMALLGWAFWPSDEQPQEPTVATDSETIQLLHSQGLSAPQTPLGEKILEAFKKDPSLRERVMTDVEKTLLEGTTPYQPQVAPAPTQPAPQAEQPLILPGPAPDPEPTPTPAAVPTPGPAAHRVAGVS